MKILFYGNCHLEAIAEHLKKDMGFEGEVLSAANYGLGRLLENGSVVAPFMYDKNTKYGEITPETINKLHKAWNDADAIVFHDFKDVRGRSLEITTEYLHSEFSSKLLICMPNFWFTGYFSRNFESPYNGVAIDIIAWLTTQGLDAKDILNWLLHEYDPKIEKLKKYNVSMSLDELKKREINEIKKYKLRLLGPDLEKLYEKKLACLCFCYPTNWYFQSIYAELSCILNFKSKNSDEISVFHEKKAPCLHECEFFKRTFPTIANDKETKKYFKNFVDLDFVEKSISFLDEDKSKYLKGWIID
jgi:hypothetical protein